MLLEYDSGLSWTKRMPREWRPHEWTLWPLDLDEGLEA